MKHKFIQCPVVILVLIVALFCRAGIAQPLNAEAIKSLQLTGPFTLTYSVTHRDVASAATKAELLQGITLSYDMALKNHQMSQSDRDDAVKQAQMGQDFPATSGTITLSVSGNRLLCSEDGLDNGPGQTVVYDGKQTLELTRAENNMQRIVTGLDRWTDIHPLLVPGVGTPYAPLIEMPTLEGSKTQNSLQTFSGDVVMNGSRMVPGEVQATFVNGRPKVLSLRELTLSKNRVVRRWDYLEHQLFDGCWIGSRMKFTTYDREQRPIAEFDMKLLQASNQSVDEKQFQFDNWLVKGDHMFYNDTYFTLDPNRGNLDEQSERERLIEKNQANRTNLGDTPGHSRAGLFLLVAFCFFGIGTIIWYRAQRQA